MSSHLEGLTFDAETADAWMRSLGPEMEEGLAGVLGARGPRPSHAPAGTSEEEEERLRKIKDQVA